VKQHSPATIQEKFNDFLYRELQADLPLYNEIVDHLQKNKGKQLRSRLCLLCAKLGGEPTEQSFRAATIVEMLHTASLLHDDIVDNSKERRGAPSINARWGNKIALFAGDVISLKALLLSLANQDYDIFKIYGEAVEKIIGGELLQLRKSRSLDLNEKTYFKVIGAKTAALFSAACKAGGITTLHDHSQVEKLGLFGENMGIAFQIRDDLFGFEKFDVGKPLDNDFKEKKMTLPLLHVLNKVSTGKKRKLKKVFKKKQVGKVDIEMVISEVKLNGGIDYTLEKMKYYREKSIEILHEFPRSETRDEMEKLVVFATERKN
jgi:octaprenyl-diphosphate synthase